MNPLDQLELSRARLRAAMLPAPPRLAAARASDGRADSWLGRLKRLPGIGLIVDAVQAWWWQHPLRPVSQVAADASNALVRPMARRRPFTLVLVAAATGAALAWTRPRRWLFRSALFAGLVPQLASRIVSSLPVEAWLAQFERPRARPDQPELLIQPGR